MEIYYQQSVEMWQLFYVFTILMAILMLAAGLILSEWIAAGFFDLPKWKVILAGVGVFISMPQCGWVLFIFIFFLMSVFGVPEGAKGISFLSVIAAWYLMYGMIFNELLRKRRK